MEYTAISKYVRVSPRKVRAIAGAVKKLPLGVAIQKLDLLPKRGGRLLSLTLKSALANAKSAKSNSDNLTIKNILIDEGVRMKRRDKSHGARYNSGMIHKQTSHLRVILADKEVHGK